MSSSTGVHYTSYTERDGNLEHHYDSNGNLIGHTERDGDRAHHYDPSWNTTGHTERDGDRAHHYDPSWNTTGHTEQDGELAHHYDPSWNSTGHTELDGNLERHYDPSWNRVGTSAPVRGGGTASGAAAWGRGGGAGGTGAGVKSFIGLVFLVSIVVFVVLLTRNSPTTYKPTTLPTGITSGPSGTSFYTGEGDPLAFQAYNDGAYFLKQSKYDQAIPYFTEAIRREPDYWYAYVNRADAYRFLGQNDLALRDYDEAVRLRSNNPQGYLGRGMIEDSMGHCQEAINDINHALSLKPTELLDVYYRVRGGAYLDCSQYPGARRLGEGMGGSF